MSKLNVQTTSWNHNITFNVVVASQIDIKSYVTLVSSSGRIKVLDCTLYRVRLTLQWFALQIYCAFVRKGSSSRRGSSFLIDGTFHCGGQSLWGLQHRWTCSTRKCCAAQTHLATNNASSTKMKQNVRGYRVYDCTVYVLTLWLLVKRGCHVYKSQKRDTSLLKRFWKFAVIYPFDK